MTLVEKIMLISAILVPIIALLMFLPKIIKAKQKTKQLPTQPYVPEPEKPSEPQPVQQPQQNPLRPANEFNEYAERKSRRISAPKRNFPTRSFPDFESFRPRQIAQPPKQEKTVLEEFQSLSPQLKALILSGALDRKDLDE